METLFQLLKIDDEQKATAKANQTMPVARLDQLEAAMYSRDCALNVLDFYLMFNLTESVRSKSPTLRRSTVNFSPSR